MINIRLKKSFKRTRNVQTGSSIMVFKTFTGAPWFVQALAGIATQVGLSQVPAATAVAPTVLKTGFGQLVASQLLGTTISSTAASCLKKCVGGSGASIAKTNAHFSVADPL